MYSQQSRSVGKWSNIHVSFVWDVLSHQWVTGNQHFETNSFSWNKVYQPPSDAAPHPKEQRPQLYCCKAYKLTTGVALSGCSISWVTTTRPDRHYILFQQAKLGMICHYNTLQSPKDCLTLKMKDLQSLEGPGVVQWLRHCVQVGRSWDRFPASTGFFPWQLTVPCALGLTQSLKMSTRLILGVKAAGA
jgi:hypothetical protein